MVFVNIIFLLFNDNIMIIDQKEFGIAIAAVVIGTAYYYQMEKSIPKESNCSYSASPMTDILAVLAGLILMYRGHTGGDLVVFGLGMVIIVEHFHQWYWNKARR